MKYPPIPVATNICGDIPPTIPISIDCSLCGLGWPQARGEIDFNLHRAEDCGNSDTGVIGDFSYWLNGAYLPGRYRFFCANPGDNAEPKANEWIAGGEFSWGSRWRIDCILSVMSKTRVHVAASIFWLDPSDKSWKLWVSFGASMDEDNPTGETDPRRVRSFKSGKIAISPNERNGGAGDVKFVQMSLGTYPQIEGCGGELCSLWDGSAYYSCFRAEVDKTGAVPSLVQLGRNPVPCGGKTDLGQFQPFCNCDRIILRADGRHNSAANSDPSFFTEYGFIGTDSGAPPYDIEQQIQIGDGVVVKKIGSSPTIVALSDGAGNWSVATPSVVQATSPTIWRAVFPAGTVYLYALKFPNPEILPDDCKSQTFTQDPPLAPMIRSASPTWQRVPLDQIRARRDSPCQYLGQPIEVVASCGCSGDPLHSCGVFGECFPTRGGFNKNGDPVPGCWGCSRYSG